MKQTRIFLNHSTSPKHRKATVFTKGTWLNFRSYDAMPQAADPLSEPEYWGMAMPEATVKKIKSL